MQRRDCLKLSVGTAALALAWPRATAQRGVKDIRIGYQKNGVLVIARQQAAPEKHFASQGTRPHSEADRDRRHRLAQHRDLIVPGALPCQRIPT